MRDICPSCKLSDYNVISRTTYEQTNEYVTKWLCRCRVCQTDFILVRVYQMKLVKQEVSAC